MNTKTTASEKQLHQQFYDIVRTIPEGKVASYSQIALLAGHTDTRDVGYALSLLQDSDIPWHRVVMHDGQIAQRATAGGQERQRLLLQQEGVDFAADCQVNMRRCGWQKVPPGGLFG